MPTSPLIQVLLTTIKILFNIVNIDLSTLMQQSFKPIFVIIQNTIESQDYNLFQFYILFAESVKGEHVSPYGPIENLCSDSACLRAKQVSSCRNNTLFINNERISTIFVYLYLKQDKR